MARPIAREAAMQLIFEQLFGGEGETQALVDLIDYEPSENDRAYIDMVVAGVKEHAADLDAEISAASRDWSIQRMPKVDLTILRLATWEILHEEDVPGSVAINEAVELAGQYSEPVSGRFINGVLGTILRKKEAAKA